jgi:hypothetical protein
MLVQHRATLLGATCWPRFNTVLDDVDLSLSLLKMFFQHRPTLLGATHWRPFNTVLDNVDFDVDFV